MFRHDLAQSGDGPGLVAPLKFDPGQAEGGLRLAVLRGQDLLVFLGRFIGASRLEQDLGQLEPGGPIAGVAG